MFSAAIEGRELLDVKRVQKAPHVARALAHLHAAMRKLGNSSEPSEETIEVSDPSVELNLFPVKVTSIRQQDGRVSTSLEFPESLLEPLETALDEAERWLVKNQPLNFAGARPISGCIRSAAAGFMMNASDHPQKTRKQGRLFAWIPPCCSRALARGKQPSSSPPRSPRWTTSALSWEAHRKILPCSWPRRSRRRIWRC
jgi:hypothetical protein